MFSIIMASSFFVSMCKSKDIIFDGNSTTFEGVVLDSSTLLTVESVIVTPIDTTPEIGILLTDSVGFFTLYDIRGSSELPFFFRKEGYFTSICTLQAGQRDTIFIQEQ
ncbi:hypothetical protein JYU19_00365 [bacterium AH-315-J21]|nr:hypothetical protein [bacterium AH-315-J21]